MCYFETSIMEKAQQLNRTTILKCIAVTVLQKLGDYRYKEGVKDVWCQFGWKIVIYSTVAFGECVYRSPRRGYVCSVACKVLKLFLLGLPYKVVDMVPLLFVFYKLLLLPKREREYQTNNRDRQRQRDIKGGDTERGRETE